LKVIVDRKSMNDQNKFEHIVSFVLSQNKNVRFWIQIMLEVQDQVLGPDFHLDPSCFREFYTDMTEDQSHGGPNGEPLDCVKFFRRHPVPKGSDPVDTANEEVMLYTIKDDLPHQEAEYERAT
jgi:hypothetical protein